MRVCMSIIIAVSIIQGDAARCTKKTTNKINSLTGRNQSSFKDRQLKVLQGAVHSLTSAKVVMCYFVEFAPPPPPPPRKTTTKIKQQTNNNSKQTNKTTTTNKQSIKQKRLVTLLLGAVYWLIRINFYP